MFDELKKYKKNDHFFFSPTDSLEEVCNAPADANGVYVVYELKNGRITLVYIGSSERGGRVIIKDGFIGLKEAIVHGRNPGKTPRAQEWPVKMLSQNIDALDIYWWITYKGNYKDRPVDVATLLLRIHKHIFGDIPEWNKTVK